MPQQTVDTASPDVAEAMRKAGVVSWHAMGLRKNLEPSATEQDQILLDCLSEIERMVKGRRAAASML